MLAAEKPMHVLGCKKALVERRQGEIAVLEFIISQKMLGRDHAYFSVSALFFYDLCFTEPCNSCHWVLRADIEGSRVAFVRVCQTRL